MKITELRASSARSGSPDGMDLGVSSLAPAVAAAAALLCTDPEGALPQQFTGFGLMYESFPKSSVIAKECTMWSRLVVTSLRFYLAHRWYNDCAVELGGQVADARKSCI